MGKQRILFVNPPTTKFGRAIPPLERLIYRVRGNKETIWSPSLLPSGLLLVAAVTRSLCEVDLLDCLVEDAIARPDGKHIQYGTAPELIKKRIRNYNPSMVAISSYFSAQVDNALHVAGLAKEVDPQVIVVAGGPHVSVAWKAMIAEKNIDYCVAGEAEQAFPELVTALMNGDEQPEIPGVISKANRTLNPRPFMDSNTLEELPFPAYDLAPKEYFADGVLPLITSRGCPYECNFCSIHLHMGKRFRSHSARYVVEHLRFLVNEYGVRSFSLEDDNISLNAARWNRILDAIIAAKLNIRWILRNGIRADTLNPEILDKMKQSGCESLSIAVESANDHVLNEIIGKKESVDTMRNAIRLVHEAGIRQSAFYIIGFPGETVGDMRRTISFGIEMFDRYESEPMLLFATPLRGTRLWDEVIREGIIENPDSLSPADWALATNLFGTPLIRKTADFSIEDLIDCQAEYLARTKEVILHRKLGRANISRIPSRLFAWFYRQEIQRELRKTHG